MERVTNNSWHHLPIEEVLRVLASVFAIGLLTNRWTIVGSAVMLGAQLLFTYTSVMNRAFHSAPIDGGAWLLIAGIAATAFVAVEFEKWIRFGRRTA